MTDGWQQRLAALGLTLPPPPVPKGSYRPVIVWNGLAHVAGQVCRTADGVVPGPVGDGTDPAIIQQAAQACVLRALSALDHEVGLDRIARIIFLRGFVFADAGFKRHSAVLDAASDLLAAILGAAGEHARSAVGVAGLPDGALLEIEVVAAVSPSDPTAADNEPER